MTRPLIIDTARLRLALLRHVAPRVADEVVAELGVADEERDEPAPDPDAAVARAKRDARLRRE